MLQTVFNIVGILLLTVAVSLGYPVCDGEAADNILELQIDNHINRLMELRRPGWGWVNTPRVVLSLQLTKMQKFFGLNMTLEKMEQEMRDEIDDTNIGKVALYAMAVKASCLNPLDFGGINIIQRISNRMVYQFRYDGKSQRIPSDRWYRYGLAVQALCVCDVQLSRYHIVRMIYGQNQNGSYGDFHSVDDTHQTLLALECVRNQGLIAKRPHLKQRLEQTILKAESFLISSVRREMNDVWIGNKYSTPGALIALMESSRPASDPSSWHCNMAVESIAEGLTEDERAAAIAQRLLALRGRSVFALKGASWTCTEPDPIPEEYEPNYDPEPTLLCRDLLPGSYRIDDDQQLIEVRLSVQKTIGGNATDLTILVEDVKEGNTLLQVMAQARCLGLLQFETVITSFGPSVRSVDGLAADTLNRQFWSLIDAETDSYLPLGAGRYKPSPGQHILFRLSTW